jgi:poly(3-hydroxybutyrate) depolymerase
MRLLLLAVILGFLLHAPAEAGWQKRAAASLDYWVYTPAKESGPRGLMLNLHGCTQHAGDFKERGNWESAAERYNMVVAIPDVPNGGVVLGCWDYYGADHDAANRHNGPLISFTESLLGDASLGLDRSRVYVAGLSSGAGQAMLLGCLRPDLFRGVGLVGSPAIGTGQYDTAFPQIGADRVEGLCRSLAGGRSFAGQRTSVVYADQDFIVSPRHSALISAALAAIYGARPAESFDVSSLEGTGTGGRGEIFRDQAGVARLSVISANGLGHAWPAGSGYGITQKYINPNSLNYSEYLGAFFTERSGDSR